MQPQWKLPLVDFIEIETDISNIFIRIQRWFLFTSRYFISLNDFIILIFKRTGVSFRSRMVPPVNLNFRCVCNEANTFSGKLCVYYQLILSSFIAVSFLLMHCTYGRLSLQSSKIYQYRCNMYTKRIDRIRENFYNFVSKVFFNTKL